MSIGIERHNHRIYLIIVDNIPLDINAKDKKIKLVDSHFAISSFPQAETVKQKDESAKKSRPSILTLLSRKLLRFTWHLAIKTGSMDLGTENFSDLKYLIPPRDRLWADPFPVKRNGKYYIFIEEQPHSTKIGVISVIEIQESGNWNMPVTILDTGYHLSHPFIFEWQDNLYMIPESVANQSVDLYRCVSFPYEWKFERTILNTIRAVDATLFETDGLIWMFLNAAGKGKSLNDQLHIYYSDNPLGEWKPHKRNPVKTDLKSTRPAGQLFTYNGELYRPGQDCSVRYGYAITINRITSLTPDEFTEEEVTKILPTWRQDMVGTHTLNHNDGLTVMDILTRQYKWLL